MYTYDKCCLQNRKMDLLLAEKICLHFRLHDLDGIFRFLHYPPDRLCLFVFVVACNYCRPCSAAFTID